MVNNGAGTGGLWAEPRIVTVGISPCWDITCRVDGISWGDHARIDSQECVPAGKALNVSRALAWMGVPSIAAGLWGRDDHPEMVKSLAAQAGLVDVRFTAAPGRTRRNVTVVDTKNAREMHLRSPVSLATAESLHALAEDLAALVSAETLFVFSGSLPDDPLLDNVAGMIRHLRGRGARVAADTSEKPLKRLVQSGDIQMIKPNLPELCELVGLAVKDDPHEIISAAKLVHGVKTVLVSRGPQGAVVIRDGQAYSGRARQCRPAVNTVGCGDWLLAGFLSAAGQPLNVALERGLKTATAKAWGWHESMSWNEAAAALEVEIAPVE